MSSICRNTLAPGQDTGGSAHDNITANRAPTVRVSLSGMGAVMATGGDVINIYVNDQLVKQVQVKDSDTYAGYIDVAIPTLPADGTYKIETSILPQGSATEESAKSAPLQIYVDSSTSDIPQDTSEVNGYLGDNSVVSSFADAENYGILTNGPAPTFTLNTGNGTLTSTNVVIDNTRRLIKITFPPI